MRAQVIETSCDRRELELERIKDCLLGNGYEISESDFDVDKLADVIIVSTCGFTQAAEDFGLKTIQRVEEQMKNGCKLIIGGCLPKINPGVLNGYDIFGPRSYEKLDEYLSLNRKMDSFSLPCIKKSTGIPAIYREHGRMESNDSELDDQGLATKRDNFELVRAIGQEISPVPTYRVRCMHGCACHCSYCAIRLAIGTATSRPIEDICNELKDGISQGYKKLCLDSDSLGCYGLDIGTNIGALLDAVIPIIENEDVIIDLPDISPAYLKHCHTHIATIANMGKLHVFYVPIQSGSQKILNLMKRGYDIEEARKLISGISERSKVVLGTSIIVGFPGESEDDFQKTIDICRDLRFKFIYCHSFSPRKGTEAATLPDRLDDDTILRRARKFKKQVADVVDYVTIAEDTKGNRTCQG